MDHGFAESPRNVKVLSRLSQVVDVTSAAARRGRNRVTSLVQDGDMNVTRLPEGGGTDRPEQLMLLPPTEVPLQFRLDERTRRRGLEHIAKIRRQLEAQAATRTHTTRPRRRAA